MTPKEAYEVLGLEPLDDFITSRAQDNPSYRCIGASTWMCVRVVLGLAKGEDALVVAPSLERGRPLRDLIGVYARRLFALNPRQRRPDLLDFGKAKVAFSGQANVVGRAGFPGTRFSDEDWKRRAIRRAQGPFAMVRVIRRETDISGNVHFYGYAEEDEYIMELTPEGAANLLEKMGLSVDGTRALPPGPEKAAIVRPLGIKGALTLDGAPVTRTWGWKREKMGQ